MGRSGAQGVVTTPLDALIEALIRAGEHNPAAEAAPEAVLWCDEGAEFAPLLPAMRARLPQLLIYGVYEPPTRTGPAVWLRAAIGRALADPALPVDVVPIVYLPGIGRETLRAAEDCPPLLQPLVWLTVVGNRFGHVNGKDWTLRGILSAERGPLRLEVPDDAATRGALGMAAARLFATPLDRLRGQRLDADALHALLAPDLAADALDWLEGALAPVEERFAAFAAQARKELKLDPAKASRHDGAVGLAAREGRWAGVWDRFAATAGAGHPGVVRLLDGLQPPDLLADLSGYPRVNREAEERLRKELSGMANLAHATAEARVLALEEEHGRRRETVWARRGEAPLAVALAHLVTIVEATTPAPHDAAALAASYAETGWRADLAALDALAAAPRAVDRDAVTAALRAVYFPWLEDGATALQTLAKAGRVPFAVPGTETRGEALLFVDGLRLDLARRLADLLGNEGAQVKLSWRWSGFPTVTATCKPLLSPAAAALRGAEVAGELYPVTADGRPARKATLDKLMNEAGWATSASLLPEGKLWTEAGAFDKQGHALGARMVDQLATGLRDVVDRTLALVRAGRKVRIVTDHGWLLLPGGLPTCALDSGLVEPDGKRSRCAQIKPAATTSYLQLPWSWNRDVYVAAASGAHAFLAGQEYAHGGISPQECVLPVIEVAPLAPTREVRIVSAAWQGLRLRVVVSDAADLRIDLRAGSSSSGPSLAKGMAVVDEAGKASLLVSDEHEGKSAILVVLDDDDEVVASRAVTVGQMEA